MTVVSDLARVQYAGNGTTRVFSTGFAFQHNQEVKVVLTEDVTGNEIVQRENAEYGLTGATGATDDPTAGTVSMYVPPAIGFTLTIMRDVQFVQDLDGTILSTMSAADQETAYDKIWQALAQLKDGYYRTIHSSDGAIDPIPGSWVPVLAMLYDGTRCVVQVTSWVGGEGPMPTAGMYIGPVGYVTSIADATDIRGLQGVQGIQGIQGVKGDQGLQGPVGPKGADSTVQGPVGPPGGPGPVGPQGIAGTATAIFSSVPPAGAADSALWFDTTSGQLFILYNDGNSTQWVVACPSPDPSAYALMKDVVAKSGDTMTGNLTVDGVIAAAGPYAALALYAQDDASLRWAMYGGAGALYFNSSLHGNVAYISGVGDLVLTGRATVGFDPTAPLHVATKQYVDAVGNAAIAAANTKVSKSGDTMTGNLSIAPASSNANMQISAPATGFQSMIGFTGPDASWQVGRQSGGSFLLYDGVAGVSPIVITPNGATVDFSRAVNLPADPTQPLYAATKRYVDNAIANMPTGGIISIERRSASATITIPPGAHKLRIKIQGETAFDYNGQAAAGSYLEDFLTGLTPGNTIVFTKGATPNVNTQDGGTTVLSSGSQNIGANRTVPGGSSLYGYPNTPPSGSSLGLHVTPMPKFLTQGYYPCATNPTWGANNNFYFNGRSTTTAGCYYATPSGFAILEWYS